MEPLTRGELRALQATARFETSKEAAAVLGITEPTLRNVLAHAFRKLGVHNKTSAFRRMGWLRPPRLIELKDDDLESDQSRPAVMVVG